MTTINPGENLVTSPKQGGLDALWVHSDLRRSINLDTCEDDERPLQQLFTLPRAMNDSTIADNVGGLVTLNARRATLGQLVREINLARAGQKGLFKKGRYYLLYLEASDGSLVTVDVDWNADDSEWDVYWCRFGQNGKWDEGFEVCGN